MPAAALELPALPIFSQKAFKLFSDTDVSIERIKRLLNTDERFSAGVRKMAVSGLFGQIVKDEPLTKTILRLGLPTLRNIIEAMSVRHIFKRNGVLEELLWMQMIGAACASRAIARHTRLSEPEDAFTAGLLHDVGKVALLNNLPDAFERVFKEVSGGKASFPGVETGAFGFSQRDLGAEIVKRWGYPETLANLIMSFDNSDQTIKNRYAMNLVAVVTASDRICMKLGIGWKRPFADIDFGNLLDALGMDDGSMSMLVTRIKAEFESTADLYLY